MKKKTFSYDTPSEEAPGEPSILPPVETTEESMSGEISDVPLVCKEKIQENTRCEECGFKAKSNCGLMMHKTKQHIFSQIDGAYHEVVETISKETQTDESCHYCKEFIESLDIHNISVCFPKNKAAETQVFYQGYGRQNIGPGNGFSASQLGW